MAPTIGGPPWPTPPLPSLQPLPPLPSLQTPPPPPLPPNPLPPLLSSNAALGCLLFAASARIHRHPLTTSPSRGPHVPTFTHVHPQRDTPFAHILRHSSLARHIPPYPPTRLPIDLRYTAWPKSTLLPGCNRRFRALLGAGLGGLLFLIRTVGCSKANDHNCGADLEVKPWQALAGPSSCPVNDAIPWLALHVPPRFLTGALELHGFVGAYGKRRAPEQTTQYGCQQWPYPHDSEAVVEFGLACHKEPRCTDFSYDLARRLLCKYEQKTTVLTTPPNWLYAHYTKRPTIMGVCCLGVGLGCTAPWSCAFGHSVEHRVRDGASNCSPTMQIGKMGEDQGINNAPQRMGYIGAWLE